MSDQPKNDSQPPMTEAQFVQMMQRIESANAGQELYARKQYRMSQITAASAQLGCSTFRHISFVPTAYSQRP